MITTGDNCELRFTDFGLESYGLFLKAKKIPEFRLTLDKDGIADGISFPSRFAHLIGEKVDTIEQSRLPFPDFLFDDQKAIVAMALDAKRFADWKDCGLGKTLEELEFSRQVAHITGGRVLIVTFNEVVGSILEEADKFYGDLLPIARLETREEMRQFCSGSLGGVNCFVPQIAITNYEKFNPTDGLEVIPELRQLAGIVLDESSRLKTGGGKQKWSIIKSSRGIPYKFSATGTPAPNEIMEFASQASFLERIRDEHDVIWTYFTRDPKTQEWTVKKHARPHFFRWMASWSIYVADPRAYGWRLGSKDVPEPKFIYEEIAPTPEQVRLQHAASASGTGTADLFGDKRLGMVSQLQLLEAAKGFIYRKSGDGTFDGIPSAKPDRVAEIAAAEVAAGRQTLIWCEFDAEVEILANRVRYHGVENFETLGGSTKAKDRARIIADFKSGKLPLLIAKAKMLGWGQNFQNCLSMIFSGFSDSFESFYQAVRRSYRYGQKKRLRVFIPYVPILEGPVLRNLLDKVSRFGELIREQQAAYLAARKELE